MKPLDHLPEAVFEIEEMHIASWSPEENEPCTQVHVLFFLKGSKTPLAIRFKSREGLDRFVSDLHEHRDFVWPIDVDKRI